MCDKQNIIAVRNWKAVVWNISPSSEFISTRRVALNSLKTIYFIWENELAAHWNLARHNQNLGNRWKFDGRVSHLNIPGGMRFLFSWKRWKLISISAPARLLTGSAPYKQVLNVSSFNLLLKLFWAIPSRNVSHFFLARLVIICSRHY